MSASEAVVLVKAPGGYHLDLHRCSQCRRYWEEDIETLPDSELDHVKEHVCFAHPEMQDPAVLARHAASVAS